MQDRLLGEEGEAAEGPRLVVAEPHRADRPLGLERGLHLQEHRLLVHVGVGPLLLDLRLEPLEPPLHHLEIGQDQLGLQIVDVAARIGGGARGVGERAHHVQQRVGVAELLGLEPLPLALRDAGEVHHLEGGVGRLLRLEQRGQPVDARVGHPRHARVHLAARGAERRGRDGRAGQQVEQRGLAALGKADEPDLHGRPCYHSRRHGRPAAPRARLLVAPLRPLDWRGTATALMLAALWGANPVAVKVGLADAPPLRLAFFRFVLGGLVVLAYAWWTRHRGVFDVRRGRVARADLARGHLLGADRHHERGDRPHHRLPRRGAPQLLRGAHGGARPLHDPRRPPHARQGGRRADRLHRHRAPLRARLLASGARPWSATSWWRPARSCSRSGSCTWRARSRGSIRSSCSSSSPPSGAPASCSRAWCWSRALPLATRPPWPPRSSTRARWWPASTSSSTRISSRSTWRARSPPARSPPRSSACSSPPRSPATQLSPLLLLSSVMVAAGIGLTVRR